MSEFRRGNLLEKPPGDELQSPLKGGEVHLAFDFLRDGDHLRAIRKGFITDFFQGRGRIVGAFHSNALGMHFGRFIEEKAIQPLQDPTIFSQTEGFPPFSPGRIQARICRPGPWVLP